jgi:predicted amidohydrolase YtcJ
VEERANGAFYSKIQETATRAERREGVKLITKTIARSGITSVNDPQGSPEDPPPIRMPTRQASEDPRVLLYQPGLHRKNARLGRLNSMFALRSFLDAGIPATMSFDYPPGPFEPTMFLQSSVTAHRH